jgi:ATP-dependent RNA helicase DHX57
MKFMSGTWMATVGTPEEHPLVGVAIWSHFLFSHFVCAVLLGLLKQSLSSHRHLRVVLMSATLDAERFATYWDGNIPHVHIPGRTFPVVDYTLEDVLSLTRYIPPKRKGKKRFDRNPSSWNDEENSDDELEEEETPLLDHGIPMDELVSRIDETSIDSELVTRLLECIVQDKDIPRDGSILVFLAGAPEINNTMEYVRRRTKGLPLVLLPLHGGLEPREQRRVFDRAQKGFTKVILSTNVAETSVTIPDCTVVIDLAREKQASYDPFNRMPLLLEKFASKASLKQRRGRAGRVREGTCYKLISRKTLKGLEEHSAPEISRVALDSVLLQLLFLGVESGSGTFMRTLLDPPSKLSIDAAAFSLQKLGAVDRINQEGDLTLTPLGLHLAGIPSPPIVGKLLVMGTILGCRDAAIAMAAGMSVARSPFLRIQLHRKKPQDSDIQYDLEEKKQQQIIEQRNEVKKLVGNSDHALLAAIFSKWKHAGNRKSLCESLGLSYPAMREMSQLAEQFDSSLVAAGFASTMESNCNGHSWRIVHASVVSAMSNQLVKVRRPAQAYHETAEGAREKKGEARELKFFVRTSGKEGDSLRQIQEERVFIHPASANFAVGSYSFPYLVYNSMVRTSKPFLRDVTEGSPYALLLFGGELEIQASKGQIVVDGWAQLSANARIGSLMGGLRERVDVLLTKKVNDPSYELVSTREMKLIVKLLMTDGLGN